MSGLVACTGNQFCGFSNIASKQDGMKVAEHLECTLDFPRCALCFRSSNGRGGEQEEEKRKGGGA
jgi:hypothetical protein